MPCTVQSILNNPQLTGIKLLAGHNQVDTVISWLNILELLGDLTRLQEGELLLTTGFDLSTHSVDYASLILKLQSLRISGLVIKLGTYIQGVPQVLIEQANILAFPLLEIPADVSLSKVSRSIIAQIKENENQKVSIFNHDSDPVPPHLPVPTNAYSSTYRVILAQLDSSPEFHALALPKNPQELSKQVQAIFSFVEQALRSYFPEIYASSHPLASTYPAALVFILQDDSTLYLEDLRSILAQIISETKSWTNLTISFGVSNLCPNQDSMPLGLNEAQEAVNVGKHILNQGYVTLYENVELYRLFLQVPERKALIEFSKKTLERIVEYDHLHGTELVRTLETYIQNDHSIKRTAELLYIHRHTVKNRLSKIEEITKISFRTEERFQLEFALTLKHLYRIKF